MVASVFFYTFSGKKTVSSLRLVAKYFSLGFISFCVDKCIHVYTYNCKSKIFLVWFHKKNYHTVIMHVLNLKNSNVTLNRQCQVNVNWSFSNFTNVSSNNLRSARCFIRNCPLKWNTGMSYRYLLNQSLFSFFLISTVSNLNCKKKCTR